MNVTFKSCLAFYVSLPYVCMYILVCNSMCMLVSISVCVHVFSVHSVECVCTSVYIRMLSVCTWCMYASVYVCGRMLSVCAWCVCVCTRVCMCVRMLSVCAWCVYVRECMCVYVYLYIFAYMCV